MEVLLKYASYLTMKGITTILWLYEGVKIRIFFVFFKKNSIFNEYLLPENDVTNEIWLQIL